MSILSMIEKVSIRLIGVSPFYASLLSQCRKIEVSGDLAKQIPTEAVSVENGRINFYYNPQFLETLTVDEAVGVLQHEMNHLVYGHCTRMKDEFKENAQLANIAADLNANKNIPKLPKGACTVESISKELNLKLKDDDTSENYYKELLKNAPKMEVQDNGDGTFTITMKDKNGKTTGQITIKPVDCHDKWGKNDQSDVPELAKEVIRQAIKEAAEQSMKQQGHLPNGMESVIKDWLTPPTISWNSILKNWLINRFKSGKKNSWKRPNRRFGAQQKGHLPVRIPAITVHFDTSGSMNEEDLLLGVAELKGIQTVYRADITVLEGDAEIQKQYKLTKYSKPQLNFKGRGGTSFVPIFEYIKDKKISTDICVVFTDMYGDFPKDPPPYPVIWVSTSGVDKAPFGVVLNVQKHPAKEKK